MPFPIRFPALPHHGFAAVVLGLLLGLGLPAATQATPRKPHTGQTAPSARKADRRELPPSVLQALRRAGVPRAAISVLVTPLPAAGSTGEPPQPPPGTRARKGKPPTPASTPGLPVRLAFRAREAMNPASVMKLVTTYAALDLLGPAYTWSNRVYLDGPLQDGVLHGNLIVRGSGDPKLVIERLQALLQQVQQARVRSIQGDIVLDRSVFDLPDHPAAFDDEPLRPYNVAPDGLLVNFGSLILHFSPNEAHTRALVRSEPPLAGLTVPPGVPLDSGPCTDWRSGLLADFSQPEVVRLGGTYPEACGEQDWPIAYPDAHGYAARVIEAVWRGQGGQLSGTVHDGSTPAQARLLLASPSLPLGELVADVNKFSNNVMAQQIFLTLSAAAQGHGSFAASRQRVAQWWKGHWPQVTAPVLDNGSGLSRRERVSALSLTHLLRQAATSPQAQPFADSLALAGMEGTSTRLRDRLPDSPALGHARLKTGTLRDVVALAGYVDGQSGQRYTLVAIINHEHAQSARAALDQLLDWTARDLPAASP